MRETTGGKGGRLSERDVDEQTPYGDISYSASIVFLVVLSSYHKSSHADLIIVNLNVSVVSHDVSPAVKQHINVTLSVKKHCDRRVLHI